jgi:lipopolysaccharide export system permease protein
MAYTPGGRDLYLTLEDGDIQEVSRTDPAQFNRTFFRTNRMRVTGVSNAFEPTQNDSYKSDREMSVCEMEAVVTQARREAERARQDARLAIENDLRRLAGLAPAYLPARADADVDPELAAGLYCRALRRVAAWLAPAAAAAQTPQHPRPRAKGVPQSARPTPRPSTVPPWEPARRTPAPAAAAAPGSAAPAPRAVYPPSPYPGATATLITPGASVSEEQRVRSARQRAAMYEVEIQKKYAIAAACLIFALVGAPLALRYYRGGVGLVIGASVAVFTVYYVGLIKGEDLGDRLVVSPFVAMWVPNLLFGIAGLIGVWRIRKPGDTK